VPSLFQEDYYPPAGESWLDWLQVQAEKGRADPLQALRAARRSAPVPEHSPPANQLLVLQITLIREVEQRGGLFVDEFV
jgi:hypothetical protein